MSTPFSALIFDLDGTLIDSAEDIAASLNYTLQYYEYAPVSLEQTKTLIGDGVRALIADATANVNDNFLEEAQAVFEKHYQQHCVDHTTLYPGVAKTLEALHFFPKAVVSNKPYAMVIHTLSHFSLDKHFRVILGAESTVKRKPHPDPILKAVADLRAHCNKTLMIGDGTADIQAGKAAGTLTCAVGYGYRPAEILRACQPDFWAEQFTDVERIVLGESVSAGTPKPF